MQLFTAKEAAEKVGVNYSTVLNWNKYKFFIPEEKQNGVNKYTAEQLNDFICDKERKTINRKLVVLTLNPNNIKANLKVLGFRFGNENDDECIPVVINGVSEEELLSNDDFMELIKELSEHLIYRLVVYRKDFREGSVIFNLLKTICKGERISFKVMEGDDQDEK